MATIVKFRAEDLIAQREARKMVDHDRRIILTVMIAGFVVLLVLAVALSARFPIYLVIIPVVVFYIVMRIVINWRQWQALLACQVKCPSCRKPVADRIHLFKPPTSHCPHCGKRALATLEQLKE